MPLARLIAYVRLMNEGEDRTGAPLDCVDRRAD